MRLLRPARNILRYASLLAAALCLLVFAAPAFAFDATNVDLGGSGGTNAGCGNEYLIIVTGVNSTFLGGLSTIQVKVYYSNGTTATLSGKQAGQSSTVQFADTTTTAGLGITRVDLLNLPTGATFNNVRVSHRLCEPAVPEVPLTVIYPLIGAATLGAGFGLRRLRRRQGAEIAAK